MSAPIQIRLRRRGTGRIFGVFCQACEGREVACSSRIEWATGKARHHLAAPHEQVAS